MKWPVRSNEGDGRQLSSIVRSKIESSRCIEEVEAMETDVSSRMSTRYCPRPQYGTGCNAAQRIESGRRFNAAVYPRDTQLATEYQTQAEIPHIRPMAIQ